MKKKVLTLFAAAALVISMCIAVNAAYGDSSDPLITKSYLDSALSTQKTEILASVDTKLAGVSDGSVSVTADLSYTAIQLTKGQTVKAKSGSIEVLLRRGSFVAVDPLGDHLINMTDGGEAADTDALKLQNLYVIARADGRGIQATADDNWVMIRGSYEIA